MKTISRYEYEQSPSPLPSNSPSPRTPQIRPLDEKKKLILKMFPQTYKIIKLRMNSDDSGEGKKSHHCLDVFETENRTFALGGC